MAHADHHAPADAHDADDAHDDHHEPPPPEEPHTPGWLTMLGAVLFLIGGGVFLLKNVEPAGAVKATEAKPKSEPAAVVRPAQPAPQVIVAQPAGPAGLGQAPRPGGTTLPGLPPMRRANDAPKQ